MVARKKADKVDPGFVEDLLLLAQLHTTTYNKTSVEQALSITAFSSLYSVTESSRACQGGKHQV